MRKIDRPMFQAADGALFSTERDCLLHEATFRHVYVVRGGRGFGLPPQLLRVFPEERSAVEFKAAVETLLRRDHSTEPHPLLGLPIPRGEAHLYKIEIIPCILDIRWDWALNGTEPSEVGLETLQWEESEPSAEDPAHALEQLQAKYKKLEVDHAILQMGYRGQTEKLEQLARLEQRLTDWALTYGAQLSPPPGYADTFGDGVRAMKGMVSDILSSARDKKQFEETP